MIEQENKNTEMHKISADHIERCLNKNPTPKERGELIVKRLEKMIRDGRSVTGGVSFKNWQEMAVHEFTNAIRDSMRDEKNDSQFLTRVLAVCALAIITIGFWGTVVAADVSYDRQVTAFILIGAGGVLFLTFGLWGLRRVGKFFLIEKRRERLKRIVKFDKQLAQLEVEVQERVRKRVMTENINTS
jgi:hypothetical protein